jgi:hypothetical protein
MLLSRPEAAEPWLFQSSSDSLFMIGKVAEISFWVLSREFMCTSLPRKVKLLVGMGVGMCCDTEQSSNVAKGSLKP